MLNKEMTRKAHEIAENMRPLFATAYKLGKIYDKARAKQSKAETLHQSWTFKDAGRDWEYLREGLTQEHRDEVRETYKRSRQEWADKCAETFAKECEAETAHKVARINLSNYLQFMAHYLGDLIREDWRELVSHQGLHTLAEIINEENPRKDHSAGACSCGLYLVQLGEGYARIEAAIYTGWACGISGKKARYYQTNPAEVWHYAEKPHKMTAEQYIKNARKIAQTVAKIKQERDNLQAFARSCGLLGFVEIVGDVTITK